MHDDVDWIRDIAMCMMGLHCGMPFAGRGLWFDAALQRLLHS
jgi:hypothetical protein